MFKQKEKKSAFSTSEN